MAEARTYSNRSVSASATVRKSSKRRPKTVVTDRDKVKTSGRKTATVRATGTTTRRGNSIRTTGR